VVYTISYKSIRLGKSENEQSFGRYASEHDEFRSLTWVSPSIAIIPFNRTFMLYIYFLYVMSAMVILFQLGLAVHMTRSSAFSFLSSICKTNTTFDDTSHANVQIGLLSVSLTWRRTTLTFFSWSSPECRDHKKFFSKTDQIFPNTVHGKRKNTTNTYR